MNAILLIFLCIGASLLGVYAFFAFKRQSYLNDIVKHYPHQVEALCNIELKNNQLSSDAKKTILSFNKEYWQDWNKKISFLKSYSNTYSNVISEYILFYFPYVKDSPHYKKQGIFNTSTRYLTLIECLSYDDVLKLCLISSEEWSQKDGLLKKAEEVSLNNPDAIRELKKKDSSLSNADIVRLQKHIESLQLRFNVAAAFEAWLPIQKEFNTLVRNLRDEYAKNCGCYYYDIDFHKPLSTGKYSSEKTRVWQVFPNSISPYLEEYHSTLSFSMQGNIPEFKNRTRYYYNSVYDRVFAYIKAIARDKKLLVIFNNNTSYGWESETYSYHYDYLKSILTNNSISYINYDELHDLVDDFEFDIVFVFDFITTNPDLIYTSKIIIESFSTKIPNIVWYSMIKEYDESEMGKLCSDAIKGQEKKKNEEEQKVREEQERLDIVKSKSKSIQFIKSQLLRMNKSSWFSIFAVTNTLIGNAANSSAVKEIWMQDPSEIQMSSSSEDVTKRPGYITVKYSDDWGMSWQIFERPGEYDNIDDVTSFTYELFYKLDVLSDFIKKGAAAIDFMNNHNYLSRR